jgi:hypothetical protein
VKHAKLIGLALVAALALAGLVASVAQAEGPEWGRCRHIDPAKGKEIKKGNYEDPNCQTVATKLKKGEPVPSHKGHYEWYPGATQLCEKKATKEFKYKDSACSVLQEKKGAPSNTGKYEWGPGAKFTGKGGAGVLTTELTECEANHEFFTKRLPRGQCERYASFFGVPTSVECTSEEATGEAVGTNEVANVKVLFKGCVGLGSIPMLSAGKEPGEIETFTLKGHLGYINKSTTPRQVGVVLEPAAPGGRFAAFEFAEGLDFEIQVGVGNAAEGSFYEAGPPYTTPGVPTGNDGIISPIVPINEMSHTFTQEYRMSISGEPENETIQNVPNHFEGGPFEALEDYLRNTFEGQSTPWDSAGQEITNVNTVEGEAEIKG